MTKLSVNLNKVALIRNSRGGTEPDPVASADIAIAAGAHGLTLHPRSDARHARLSDVKAFAEIPAVAEGRIELNVEGDLRTDLMEVARAARAHQFTVVPVMPGEITSARGWRPHDDQAALREAVAFFKGVARISVFADADETSVRLAAEAGADAVEFYTGHYAVAFDTPDRQAHLEILGKAADFARSLGLRVHGGHDLTIPNLPPLIARMKPDEVSIGHQLISDALVWGLGETVRRYLAAIDAGMRLAAA